MNLYVRGCPPPHVTEIIARINSVFERYVTCVPIAIHICSHIWVNIRYLLRCRIIDEHIDTTVDMGEKLQPHSSVVCPK